jgi:hypothetical protein
MRDEGIRTDKTSGDEREKYEQRRMESGAAKEKEGAQACGADTAMERRREGARDDEKGSKLETKARQGSRYNADSSNTDQLCKSEARGQHDWVIHDACTWRR